MAKTGVAGKCKTAGRGEEKGKRYRLASRYETNKLRKLCRHLTRDVGRHHGDKCARRAVQAMTKILPVVTHRPILERYGVSVAS